MEEFLKIHAYLTVEKKLQDLGNCPPKQSSMDLIDHWNKGALKNEIT